MNLWATSLLGCIVKDDSIQSLGWLLSFTSHLCIGHGWWIRPHWRWIWGRGWWWYAVLNTNFSTPERISVIVHGVSVTTLVQNYLWIGGNLKNLPHCVTKAVLASPPPPGVLGLSPLRDAFATRSCVKQPLFRLVSKFFSPCNEPKKRKECSLNNLVLSVFLDHWLDLLFHSLTGKPSFLSNLRNPGRMVPHQKPGEPVPIIDTWSLFLFPPGNPYVYRWYESVIIMLFVLESRQGRMFLQVSFPQKGHE